MAKEIKFGAEARAALEAGVNKLADTHLHQIPGDRWRRGGQPGVQRQRGKYILLLCQLSIRHLSSSF